MLRFIEFYGSTGSLAKAKRLDERIKYLTDLGFKKIELSGGEFEPSWISLLNSYPDVKFSLHNYFPPPRDEIVLNLASQDKTIAERSLSLLKESILWSAHLGDSIFSFHAGFTLDPIPSSLGRALSTRKKPTPYSEAMSIFKSNVSELVEFASKYQVRLLVENNVLTKANASAFGQDSLLLTHADEILEFLTHFGGELGLLLDVGHLKVSSTTKGISSEDQTRILLKVADAIHLHGNDGTKDSHSEISGEELAGYIPYMTSEKRVTLEMTEKALEKSNDAESRGPE